MQNVDIVIIGAGMVGLTLAAALKNSNLNIVIIENNVIDQNLDPMFDMRVSALNRASQNILSNLGAWHSIENTRVTAYDCIKVWQQDSFAKISFTAQDILQPNLGHIVENRIIQVALLQQISQANNINIIAPAKCINISIGTNESYLNLDNGLSISAKLVVGADGANSWLRKQMSIPLTYWNYKHTAIVATIQTAETHNATAHQIFTDQSILALLPITIDPIALSSNMVSIVWSCDHLRAQELLTMSENKFNKLLTSESDAILGTCKVISKRMAFPLTMRYARDFVRERIALIGDAAHTIHPLAGQGVNLGLLDATSLAQKILAIHKNGKDIGALHNLRSFERWRKAEAAKMIASMQLFHDLFANENLVKKFIRSVGMNMINSMPIVKDELIKQALGLRGNLPLLAKQKSLY